MSFLLKMGEISVHFMVPCKRRGGHVFLGSQVSACKLSCNAARDY